LGRAVAFHDLGTLLRAHIETSDEAYCIDKRGRSGMKQNAEKLFIC
jgi:hypothetical protein